MEISEASSDVILRYTREHLCYFGTGSPVTSNLVQLPVRFHCDRTIAGSEFDYQALFDCGATSSFLSKSLFVDKWGFKPTGNRFTVKNGDGSSQLSLAYITVTLSIGCNFKAVVRAQVINLDSFDMIIGLDMIHVHKMELRHDPFRVSALSSANLRGGGRASRPLKRVNLPICINSLRDAQGHDISHYLCDTENFRADCAMQGLQEEDALVLIPDENDAFSYNQLLAQLWELHNVEAHPVAALFSKVVDVQLPQRRELSSSDSATPSGVSDEAEAAFRQKVTSDFPSLCADSLPVVDLRLDCLMALHSV